MPLKTKWDFTKGREAACLPSLATAFWVQEVFWGKRDSGLPRNRAGMLRWEGSSCCAGSGWPRGGRSWTHTHPRACPGGVWEKHLTLTCSWAPGMTEGKVGARRWLKPSDPSSGLWVLLELRGSLKGKFGTAEAKQAGRSAQSPSAFCFEFSGVLEDLCSVCVLESKVLSVQCWLQGWGAGRWTQQVWPMQGSHHAFNVESKIKQTWFSLDSLSM